MSAMRIASLSSLGFNGYQPSAIRDQQENLFTEGFRLLKVSDSQYADGFFADSYTLASSIRSIGVRALSIISGFSVISNSPRSAF